MSPERKRSILTWAPVAFSGATLVTTLYCGMVAARIDRHLAHALTVEDGEAWCAAALTLNPTLKLPSIREIHWRNFEDESRSMLRR